MHKPTPAELADFINEDEFGNPMTTQTPISPAISAGPASSYDRVPSFDDDRMPLKQTMTEMRSCSATSCSNNEQGRCGLQSISVNEHGGCAEYEAAADCQQGNGRYEETDDSSGGVNVAPYNPDVVLR